MLKLAIQLCALLLVVPYALAVDAVFSLSPCVTSIQWSLIDATCAAAGGVVCSLAQIDAVKARVLPCGLSTSTRVWTSTPCVNSKSPSAPAFVVALGSGSDANTQCSLTSQQSHGLVCCTGGASASPATATTQAPVPAGATTQAPAGATTQAPVASSTAQPTPATTAQPTPATTAAPNANPSACPTCPFATVPCQQSVTLATAQQSCASAGARLCTANEIQNPGAKSSYGCSLATTRVWTSTTCINSKNPSAPAFTVVLGAGSDSNTQCSQTTNANSHGVLCCAGETPPTPPPPPPPTYAPTTLYFVPGPTCVGLSLFTDAQNYCASQNGRLCTATEMKVPKSGLGCNVVGQRAWTSTACTSSKDPSAPAYVVSLAEGGDTNTQCSLTAQQTKAVVCCSLSTMQLAPSTAPVEYEETAITGAPSAGTNFANLTAPLPLPAAAQRTVPMAKNVVLIVVDDLKTALRSYGDGQAVSPNVDRLAARGVRFSRAYTQYAECGPSRSSFLTGMRPDKIQVFDLSTNFRATVKQAKTIPMLFKANGYYTVMMGKIFDDRTTVNQDEASRCWTENPAFNTNKTFCFDIKKPTCTNPGWDRSKCKCVDSPAYLFGQPKMPSIQDGTVGNGPIMTENSYVDGRMGTYGANKLSWLMNRPAGSSPFFFAFGLWKPHLPFVAPASSFNLFNVNDIEPPAYPFNPKGPTNPWTNYPPPGELASQYSGNTGQDPQALILAYLACVAYIDLQVGKLLDAFDAAPASVRDDTLIILTSDHGFHLGDHNLWAKHTNYEQAARVPFIVVPPSGVGRATDFRQAQHAGTVCRSPVELVDMMATLADMTGIAQLPGSLYPDPISQLAMGMQQGTSLRPLLSNSTMYVKAFALSQMQRSGNVMGYAVRTTRYRYVRWIIGLAPASQDTPLAEELYDLAIDYNETRNVIDDKAYSAAASTMQALFKGYANGDPDPVVPFDDGQSNEDASMTYMRNPVPTLAPAQLPTRAPLGPCPECYIVVAIVSVPGLTDVVNLATAQGAQAISVGLANAVNDLLAARDVDSSQIYVVATQSSNRIAFNVTGLTSPASADFVAQVIALDHAYLGYVLKLRVQAAVMDYTGAFPGGLGTPVLAQAPVVLQQSGGTAQPTPSSLVSSAPTSGAPTPPTNPTTFAPLAPSASPVTRPPSAPSSASKAAFTTIMLPMLAGLYGVWSF